MIYQKTNTSAHSNNSPAHLKAGLIGACFSLFSRSSNRRFSSLFLALLMILSVSAGLTVLTPPAASAVSLNDMTPTQKAQSWAYLNATRKCVRDSLGARKTIDVVNFGNLHDGYWKDILEDGSANSGQWWKDEFKIEASYLLSNADDGKVSCNEILKNGAQVWGYGTDFKGLLCSFVPTRSDGSTCQGGSAWFNNLGDRVNAFDQVIKDRIYGGQGARVGNVELYPIYKAVFFSDQGCKVKASTVAPGQGNGDLIYRDIKVVDPATGKITVTTFEGVSRGTTKSIYTDDNLSVNRQSCGYIADRLNEYGDAYSDAITVQEKPDTPPATSNECAVNPTAPGCAKDEKTSCAVEGIGWIVCPVAGFLGMLTDGLFGVLTTLLSFTPVAANGATYDTWQAMRNIANAAFVIAFLIIIFSQLTGYGITNYGIKKMIPRLIAAAILVNVSYFICQIAVDLANIAGYSLQSLMTNASKTASGGENSLDVWGDLIGWVLAGGIGTLGVGGLALSIGAAGGWIPALALLLPVLVTVLFAVLTVVLVLAARQALIIILIVISPLAFVAYLLPNTEDWFHKWRKLFITLLLMFPIISVIFGGSQLAAAVIRAGTNNPLIYILSLAVQVIPFFLVPIIMKTAGGLLNRFGGMVNNPNKGPFDKLRKRAEGYAGYKVNDARSRNLKYKGNANRFSFAGSARRKAEREAVYSSADNRAKEAGVEYIGGRLAPDEVTGDPTDTAFARKMAGSNDTNAIMMAMARGASAVDEIEAKELKAAQVILSNARVDGENLLALSGGADGKGLNGQTVKGSAIMQMAASASLFAQGRQMDTVVENLLTSAHDPNNAADKKRILDFTVGQIQSSYPKAKEKQVGLTDEALMKGIADGNVTASNLSESLKASAAKKAADLSVDFLASQEKSSMEYIQAGMQSVDADKAEKIRATSIKVTQTPSAIAKTNKDTYSIIEQISQSTPNTQIPGQGTFF